MFQQLRMVGFGAHEDTTLVIPDPRGANRFRGPSEAGKTTIITAVTFALWGEMPDGKPFRKEVIRDNWERCQVGLTTAKSATVERSITASRNTRRTFLDKTFSTEDEWRQALGPMGGDVDLLRLILVPLHWRDVLGADSKGTHLRNRIALLSPSIPLRDVVRELMGDHVLRDNDPDNLEGCKKLRASAKKELAQREGGLLNAKSRQVEQVDIPDTTEALATIEAARAWEAYRAAEQTVKAAQEWDHWQAELGERPASGDEAINAAQVVVNTARAAANLADEAMRKARTAREDARSRVQAIGNLGKDPDLTQAESRLKQAQATHASLEASGDTCPTCQRPGWEDAAQRLATAAALVAKLGPEVEALRASSAERREQQLVDAKATLAQTEADATRLGAEQEASHAALNEANVALGAARLGNKAVEDYDRAIRMRGQRPNVLKMETPNGAEPSKDEVRDARQLLRDADRARGAAEAAERVRSTQAADIARLEAAVASATAEVARTEALVSAVQLAPTEVARRSVELLGDLGPVSLVFDDGPGVEVHVDGRPWWLASQGRLVVADLWLRVGIRRAMALRVRAAAMVPIVVDQEQSWSGEWPEVEGPVWLLQTDGSVDGIVVEAVDERPGVTHAA